MSEVIKLPSLSLPRLNATLRTIEVLLADPGVMNRIREVVKNPKATPEDIYGDVPTDIIQFVIFASTSAADEEIQDSPEVAGALKQALDIIEGAIGPLHSHPAIRKIARLAQDNDEESDDASEIEFAGIEVIQTVQAVQTWISGKPGHIEPIMRVRFLDVNNLPLFDGGMDWGSMVFVIRVLMTSLTRELQSSKALLDKGVVEINREQMVRHTANIEMAIQQFREQLVALNVWPTQESTDKK